VRARTPSRVRGCAARRVQPLAFRSGAAALDCYLSAVMLTG
jgi:hypothetical protein